jgi:hypothetical protein
VTERPVAPACDRRRERAIPIAQFLNGENFDPETTHAMGVALEIACVALQLRNRYYPAATATVAEKIIALAKAGERCPTTLCDRALSELGYVSDDPNLPLPRASRPRRPGSSS